jgi:hypothetical protein
MIYAIGIYDRYVLRHGRTFGPQLLSDITELTGTGVHHRQSQRLGDVATKIE